MIIPTPISPVSSNPTGKASPTKATKTSLTIRDLPSQTKQELRVKAARSGLSLEAYARFVLQAEAQSPATPPLNLAELALEHFGKENGVELELAPRQSSRPVPEFD